MTIISKGKLIKIKLLQYELTQRDIANDLDFTEAYISMLVSGKRTNEDFDTWVRKNLGVK